MDFEKEGTSLEKMRIGQSALKLDYSLIEDVTFDGIDFKDVPDFCDAFICDAKVEGRQATDEELDQMNDDGQFRYDMVMESVY